MLVGPVARATVSRTPAWSPEAATYGYGVAVDQAVEMSDGTVLRADVYYPTTNGRPAAGPFPVLLQQTPYGKDIFAPGNSSSSGASLANTDVPYLVDRGYMVVISDVRGTGDSGGTFGLFDPVQQTDGATLARWAAALPHSDGKVGLFGESYMGIDQFLTVAGLRAQGGAPVKAMFPIISGHDIYSDTVTQGGIPDVEFSAFYLALVAGLNAANPLIEPLSEAGQTSSPRPVAAGLQNLAPVEAAHNKALASYDAATLANVETGGNEAYDGDYWHARSPASYLGQVVGDHIPAFLVGGWNDLFQQGELQNYAALQNLAAGRNQDLPMDPSQPVTPRYQLLMGPWQHVTTGAGVNLAAIELEWFDTWLKGERTPLATTATPLHLEQLHSGRWVDTAYWPLREAATSTFYLGAGRSGSAGLSANDGTLATTAPSARSGADPVAWTSATSPCSMQSDQWSGGFPAVVARSLNSSNPCDSNDVTLEAGPGALTYTTAPFKSDQVLGGPIDATLYATSTTKDTEFVATVEEVSPGGQSVPLTSGALLGSFRALATTRSWYDANGNLLLPMHPFTKESSRSVTPGKVTEFDVTVFPTFAEVPAGWRLRVTITTGDSPHLGPTAVQLANLVGGVYQVQRDSAAASHVNFPLAPASAFATACGALCSPAGP